jgi:hypothetical protein
MAILMLFAASALPPPQLQARVTDCRPVLIRASLERDTRQSAQPRVRRESDAKSRVRRCITLAST